MKLVRIQPYLLSLQPRHGPCFLSAQEKRAVADKQVAIIDKALGSNPTNPLLVKERSVLSCLTLIIFIKKFQIQVWLG
jgi:hypothetical protein